jgi:uncharacterized membrane protein
MRKWATRTARQHGSFLIAAGVFMLVLVGFVGLAIDLSRMALIRAELQGAADACVLASVSQLNGASEGPMRAEVTGQFLGGLKNRHSFQSVAVGASNVQVTFSPNLNGAYRASHGGALASSRLECTRQLHGGVGSRGHRSGGYRHSHHPAFAKRVQHSHGDVRRQR